MSSRGVLTFLFAAVSAVVAKAEGVTNLWHEVGRRFSVSAYADVESAYWARGAIVDNNPYSAQFTDLSFDFDPLGRIGGYAWSVSSMSRKGQAATRRNAYNEVDYGVYYDYRLEIVDGWVVDNMVAKKWVTLPGYRPHAHSISEWNVSQALENPYVTPYYLLRRAYHGQIWCYWDVGIRRSFEICERLTFTAQFFGELGDSRHFAAQYGANPNARSGGYSDGLMALNLLLRLDYAITEEFGVFAFVHQFDVVNDDARAALDANTNPESLKDLTMFGVGITLKF